PGTTASERADTMTNTTTTLHGFDTWTAALADYCTRLATKGYKLDADELAERNGIIAREAISPAARKELVLMTGLSMPTINRIARTAFPAAAELGVPAKKAPKAKPVHHNPTATPRAHVAPR